MIVYDKQFLLPNYKMLTVSKYEDLGDSRYLGFTVSMTAHYVCTTTSYLSNCLFRVLKSWILFPVLFILDEIRLIFFLAAYAMFWICDCNSVGSTGLF